VFDSLSGSVVICLVTQRSRATEEGENEGPNRALEAAACNEVVLLIKGDGNNVA
jgi:hypothetical protein